MILRTTHIPTIYTGVPADPVAGTLHCCAVVAVMQDALRNCVILVDGGGVVEREMAAGVLSWPIKHQQRGKELLKKLMKNHRIIGMQPTDHHDSRCEAPGCGYVVGISEAQRPEAVITSVACACQAECVKEPLNAVHLTDYAVSPFSGLRQRAECLELDNCEWSKNQFEAKVLHPLFRYAKHVAIYDRVVGHALYKAVEKTRYWASTGQRGPEPVIQVGANFTRGLEWLFAQYVASSRPESPRMFELNTAVEGNRLSPAEIQASAAAIRAFAAVMSAKYGFPFNANVKVEYADADRRHARFLATDQIALLVERGFDLLDPHGNVLNVIVSILDTSTRERLVAQFGRLRDAD
jgi:hypothetical protein